MYLIQVLRLYSTEYTTQRCIYMYNVYVVKGLMYLMYVYVGKGLMYLMYVYVGKGLMYPILYKERVNVPYTNSMTIQYCIHTTVMCAHHAQRVNTSSWW